MAEPSKMDVLGNNALIKYVLKINVKRIPLFDFELNKLVEIESDILPLGEIPDE